MPSVAKPRIASKWSASSSTKEFHRSALSAECLEHRLGGRHHCRKVAIAGDHDRVRRHVFDGFGEVGDVSGRFAITDLCGLHRVVVLAAHEHQAGKRFGRAGLWAKGDQRAECRAGGVPGEVERRCLGDLGVEEGADRFETEFGSIFGGVGESDFRGESVTEGDEDPSGLENRSPVVGNQARGADSGSLLRGGRP